MVLSACNTNVHDASLLFLGLRLDHRFALEVVILLCVFVRVDREISVQHNAFAFQTLCRVNSQNFDTLLIHQVVGLGVGLVTLLEHNVRNLMLLASLCEFCTVSIRSGKEEPPS